MLNDFLLLVGGVTVFLSGLKLMSDNMQAVAGEKMKRVLKRATGTGLKGVTAGALVTAVIQSSTATEIMLVGFVNAGALGLSEAISVVMGANIGTTVTAQLVSLSGNNAFDITAFGSLAAFVGFAMTFSKKETPKRIGSILLGFGTLFIGLEIMNTTICAFRDLPFFKRLFTAENPLILILNGILVTGIVQSSSAVSSVMIILAMNGLITFDSSMYLILGTNIGAGIAVLFVSAALSPDAKRVAVANIMFNVIGMLLAIGPLIVFEDEITAFFAAFSGGIERQVANFHTIFNIAVTAVLLPLLHPFEKLVVALTTHHPFHLKRPHKRTHRLQNNAKSLPAK